jgi:polysaccharide biosynthesis/export protein
MTHGRMPRAAELRHPCGTALAQWLRAAALLGALVFSPPLLANSPEDGRAYKLAPGDRINVAVFGQADLSGDILIDDVGNILLPFIGPIHVANLTILECQKVIRDRLTDGILNQPSVSVRISELRPIFILGDVRTPGTHPFRYGSTVKTAVAAAGGFGLAEPAQIAAISDFLLADERVRQLTFQKRTLLVRSARLEAQRDGMKAFSPPSSVGIIDGNEITNIVANETDTFEAQAAILNQQLDLLRSQKPRIQNEIAALNAQIATAKKQIEIIKHHADQYSRMVRQGLGVTNTELQFKLAEATHESELWRLTAHISRLQMDTGELDFRTQEVEASFKRQLVIELRDVRERLRELDVTLPAAREMREVKLRQAGTLAGADAARLISITRIRNGEATEFRATEATRLEPGDIIDVKKFLPPGVAARERLAEPAIQPAPLSDGTNRGCNAGRLDTRSETCAGAAAITPFQAKAVAPSTQADLDMRPDLDTP